MKRIITVTTATFALLGLSGVAMAATTGFTAAEGYVDGPLKDHPEWVAQDQWGVHDSAGAGLAQDTSGAFVRANYRGASSPNGVLDRFTISATYSYIGNFTGGSTNNAVDEWREPSLILDVTEQGVSTSPGRMGATLAVDDEPAPMELQFRFSAAADNGTAVSLGPATDYDGHSFTMEIQYVKLDATNYSVVASIDSLGDAAGPFVITNDMVTPAPEFSNAQSVYGFLNSVNGSVNGYGGVQVDEFSFDFIEPTVIASSPVVGGKKTIVNTIQFETTYDTKLQVASALGDELLWQDVPGAVSPSGESRASFVDEGNVSADQVFYRVAEDVPPPPLWMDDFEGGQAAWTASSTGGTAWELGTPNMSNSFITIVSAASGDNCWATDLDLQYADGTDSTLTSPQIDLSAATTSATLKWQQRRDIDDTPAGGDVGTVTITDVTAGGSEVVLTTYGEDPGGTDPAGWTEGEAAIPASMLGHVIQIEFNLTTDLDPNLGWAGWYIDDVKITE